MQRDADRRCIDDSHRLSLCTFTMTQLDSFIAVRRMINTEIIQWRQFAEDFHGTKNNSRFYAASSSVNDGPIKSCLSNQTYCVNDNKIKYIRTYFEVLYLPSYQTIQLYDDTLPDKIISFVLIKKLMNL